MELSFSSCLNTWLFGLIAIALLRVLLSDVQAILSVKRLGFLSFMMAIILIRLLFPVEFLYLQSDIYIAKLWADIYKALTQSAFVFGGIKWNPVTAWVILSLIVSSVLAIWFIFSYLKLRHSIWTRKRVVCTAQSSHLVMDYCQKMGIDGIAIYGALQRVFRERKKNTNTNVSRSFCLIIDRTAETPFVLGIFKPVIVLPAVSLAENEWYYILKHEIAHIEQHDLLMRFLCEVLQLLYWWNPLAFRLRPVLQRVQEFRADAAVCERLTEFQRLEYMECLLKMARRQSSFEDRWIAAFQQETELPARIKALLRQDKKNREERKTSGKDFAIMLLIVLFGFLLPNIMIIKPYYPLPVQVEQIAADSDISGGYYVVCENETYNIHVDGNFFRINQDNHVTYKPVLGYRLKLFTKKDS